MNYHGSAAQPSSDVLDDIIDLVLCTMDQNTLTTTTIAASLSPIPIPIPITIGQENIPPISMPPMNTPKQGPKSSTFGSIKLDTAIVKATSAIQCVPKKCSIEDTFLVVQG